MRSKHDLTHAFLFAAAAESARRRVLRPAERRPARRPRPMTFRRRADTGDWAVFRASPGAPAPQRDAVFTAIQVERQLKWMHTQIAKLRADDAYTRRLCGKRIPPP